MSKTYKHSMIAKAEYKRRRDAGELRPVRYNRNADRQILMRLRYEPMS